MYVLEFSQNPFQNVIPRQTVFSQIELNAISLEVEKFLEKGIIQESNHEVGEFISSIFLRPKKDGSFRMILNLKHFNDFIVYHHFKMDTVQSVINLIEKDCYMASLDLKDACDRKSQEIFEISMGWKNLSIYIVRVCLMA